MLEEIIKSTRSRLARTGVSDAGAGPPRRSFRAALLGPDLHVIAEIKRRSPSAGDLAPGLDPVTQARAYASGGAAAISVLTEPQYFGGSLDDLRRVRDAVSLPILRKDFIVDPRQVTESRVAGADAMLLIVAAVDEVTFRLLMDEARDVGIDVLVEAHNEAEARIAADVGSQIIGVNNRDLKTFRTDLSVAERLAPELPEDTILVAESGVSTPDGAARMAAAGYNAILVGEALVTAPDPVTLLLDLRRAGN